MSTIHQGSCLCGGIAYEITGPVGEVVWCHCEKCRKGNGTAFLVTASVNETDFRCLRGSELLTRFETSPGVSRCFCSRCGSPLYGKRDSMPGILRLRLGTLDTPFDARATQHIFTAYKAPWFDIHDEAPQHPERT